MYNIAVLGGFAGDEGKGRIVHDLSPQFDWIVRFNGGANAGHTIYRDGVKYVHNLMPSFDWRSSRPKAFLGSGMVIDLEQLLKEVNELYAMNPFYCLRVYVDPEAFLVLPKHKLEDKANNSHIGSTNRGIGPAYKDKIARAGVRIRDILLCPHSFEVESSYIQKLTEMGVKFQGVLELYDQFASSNILFEGAQGVMLDINHGTYPYVSCSDATVAGIYSSGFSFVKLYKVYGVVKCYSTRVGEGPFPTEVHGEEAHQLRELGKEYGATTGRPRRIGWLDLPALRYACIKGGITHLIITKFDILNGLDTVKICSEYERQPVCPQDFFKPNIKYISVPGWKNASNIQELNPFITMVSAFVGCKVEYVSTGTDYNDLHLLR